MAQLTLEGLVDVLGVEFAAVNMNIRTSVEAGEKRIRDEMNRRFDRVDVRFDEMRAEFNELRAEFGGQLNEIKSMLRRSKRRKR